jgi:hypothetical protein
MKLKMSKTGMVSFCKARKWNDLKYKKLSTGISCINEANAICFKFFTMKGYHIYYKIYFKKILEFLWDLNLP